MTHHLSFQVTNPHTGFFRCARHSGLLRALPAALICGFSAVAMAAEIQDAVRDGDAAAVSRLLKKDPKLVNLADEKTGAPPLYHAVDAGNPEMVKILLKAGAKVNVKTADGMTPMLRAAAITNQDRMAGWWKVPLSFFRNGSGTARAASREALKTFQKSLVPDTEQEEARLAILRLLVEHDGSMLDVAPDTQATPLHIAAFLSNSRAMEFLLEHGADPEASATGLRPLHLAVLRGDAEMVKVLLARKADVNAALPNGMRPLHVAAIIDVATVRLLLDHGAEVNAVNKNGAPALHNATWNDEIFNLLLERGANPKLQQSDGTTTLHMACQDGSKALVEKLLETHPDIDAWDAEEFTPLLNAAEVGRVDLLRLLVAAGAHLKAIQRNGRNALHLAANASSPEAVRFLLEQKLGVNEPDNSGQTALIIAAASGQLENVTILLRAGANVNGAERSKGMTALMGAAIGIRQQQPLVPPDDPAAPLCSPAADYVKIATLLLDRGANLHARDSDGKTALHRAAISGNAELVELLISKGADVNAKEADGNTPLHWAAAAGCTAALELLISKGAEVDAKDTRVGRTPLHQAAHFADVKTVALLLENGANISAAAVDKQQPIHFAAQGDHPEVIHLLVKKGADVTATESHGATPLHLAVIAGKPKMVRALLDHGAPPAALDQYQKSPLHCAALNGSVEIVRMLLDHRVPVNGADFQGDTPLHIAAMVHVENHDLKSTNGQAVDPNEDAALAAINKSKPADKLEIVKLLLKKGARPQVKNKAGITPIDFADKLGTPEILAVLKAQALHPPGK